MSKGGGKTTVIRVSDEMATSVKRIAGFKGVTPGAVIGDAWDYYWDQHQDNVVPDLHVTIEGLRTRPADQVDNERGRATGDE